MKIKGKSTTKIWTILLLLFSFGTLYADNALEEYRRGDYDQAALNINVDNKDAQSLFYLAKMRLYGYGQLKNTILAMRLFTQSADKGYIPAQELLARYALVQEKKFLC